MTLGTMQLKKPQRFLEYLIVGLAFCAANIRGLVLDISIAFSQRGAWIEALVDFIVVAAALWILYRLSLLNVYRDLWLRNWPLILFIFIALASMLWTIDGIATFTRISILVFSSMFAVYLSVRYPLVHLLFLAANFFAVLVVFSAVIALAWPDVGAMNFHPYDGSWRGIFWHRNYLGSTMALGALVFLLSALLSYSQSKRKAAFYGVFYLLSLALVILSQSATGLILAVILHGILVGVVLWLKFHQRMLSAHYWVAGGIAVSTLIISYLKLDLLLGLVNRNSTFTGRVVLWDYLFTHIISQRPFLGYGFGAFWMQNSFRLQLRDALGWHYPIFIGDNGYIDILLHLGVIGLAIFALMLVFACTQIATLAFRQRTLLAFAPLLIMVYILVTNITLSYFLETESFTWILMVAFWFASALKGNQQAQFSDQA